MSHEMDGFLVYSKSFGIFSEWALHPTDKHTHLREVAMSEVLDAGAFISVFVPSTELAGVISREYASTRKYVKGGMVKLRVPPIHEVVSGVYILCSCTYEPTRTSKKHYQVPKGFVVC